MKRKKQKLIDRLMDAVSEHGVATYRLGHAVAKNNNVALLRANQEKSLTRLRRTALRLLREARRGGGMNDVISRIIAAGFAVACTVALLGVIFVMVHGVDSSGAERGRCEAHMTYAATASDTLRVAREHCGGRVP